MDDTQIITNNADTFECGKAYFPKIYLENQDDLALVHNLPINQE